MVRILALGDLHIQPDNLAEIQVFLEKLEEWLQHNRVDLIVILGDTLHTHETVHTQCLNKMLDYIRLCEKYAPTKVLVGNHDYCSNQSFLNDAHPFVGWKKSHEIIDRVHHCVVDGVQLTFLPYVPDGRFHEALTTGGDGWKDSAVIFAHQLLDGAKMGPIVASKIEKWADTAPLVVSGHIHEKQWVQPNLWYTGSSMQVSFGEKDDHSLSLITVVLGEKPRVEEIRLMIPRKRTLYLTMAELPDLKLPCEENLRLKLSLSGDPEEFKTFKKSAQYKDLISQGIKVVFKQKKHVIPILPKTSYRSFPEILYELVEKDPGLMEFYTALFGAKQVEVVFD